MIKDRALGVLKDGVVERVTAADFLFDFAVEVVVGILGFPVATGDGVGIADGTVETDGAGRSAGGPFGDEGPIVEAGGIGEKNLKRVAEASFVLDVLGANFRNRLVIGANQAVIR